MFQVQLKKLLGFYFRAKKALIALVLIEKAREIFVAAKMQN